MSKAHSKSGSSSSSSGSSSSSSEKSSSPEATAAPRELGEERMQSCAATAASEGEPSVGASDEALTGHPGSSISEAEVKEELKAAGLREEREEFGVKEEIDGDGQIEERETFGVKEEIEKAGLKEEIEEYGVKREEIKEPYVMEEIKEPYVTEEIQEAGVKESQEEEFQKPSYASCDSEIKASDEGIMKTSLTPDVIVEEKPKGSSTIPKSVKSSTPTTETSAEKKSSKGSKLYPRLSTGSDQHEAITMETGSSDEGIIHPESEKLLGHEQPSTWPVTSGSQMRSRSSKGHPKKVSKKERKRRKSNKDDTNSQSSAKKFFRGVWKNCALLITMLTSALVISTSIASIIINTQLNAHVRNMTEHEKPCIEHIEYIINNSNCTNLTEVVEVLETLEDTNSALDRDTREVRDPFNSRLSKRTLAQEFTSFNKLNALGKSADYPAKNCASLKEVNPSTASGFYWLTSSSGSAVHRYCDMWQTCGGITGGWMRVAHTDTRDVTSRCPPGFKSKKDPFTHHDPLDKGFLDSIRTCVIQSDQAKSCSSTTYSTSVTFSKVCGRIIGYQFGSPDAFTNNFDEDYFHPGVSKFYVDGITLTYSSRYKHIWTFAAAYNKEAVPDICHCKNGGNSTKRPPNFVGINYFCDTAVESGSPQPRLYTDPLWDGNGCGQGSTECCTFHSSPPWFYRHLPEATSDDMDMTMCRDQARSDEDIGIQIIDILVQ